MLLSSNLLKCISREMVHISYYIFFNNLWASIVSMEGFSTYSWASNYKTSKNCLINRLSNRIDNANM